MPRSWRTVTETLQASDEDVVELSFDEVSELVGDLPPAELQDPGFWSNAAETAQAKAWSKAGYRVHEVDVSAGIVRFRRT